jgi:excisionase family DNA binding protein
MAANLKSGEVFTVGQIAQICHVSTHTVGKWIDNGHLRGYRIAGGKDRRTTRRYLAAFLEKNDMPAEWLTNWLKRNGASEDADTTNAADSADPTTHQRSESNDAKEDAEQEVRPEAGRAG